MTIHTMGDEGVGPGSAADRPVGRATGTWVDGSVGEGLPLGTPPLAPHHDAPTTWDRAADAFRDWRAGTPGAMDRLVTTMTSVLWHVVRASGLSEEAAQDVVQTTWVAFVRHADSVSDPQAVAAWLTMTARREAWRVSRRARSAVPVDDEVLQWFSDDGASPEEVAVVHDEEDRLWACVQQLSERCRHLLRVVAFEQRPDYARIAADLGMAVGSIGPTRGRCLAKLRAALIAAGGVS
jgi:RNA polymerase sigma factor (sigma-70 family)